MMSLTAVNYRFKEEVGFLSARRMYFAETEARPVSCSAVGKMAPGLPPPVYRSYIPTCTEEKTR